MVPSSEEISFSTSFCGLWLYISTSIWVMRTPNVGWNSHFQHFLCKRNKFDAKFSKQTFFLSLHQNAGQVFYSQLEQVFSYIRLKSSKQKSLKEKQFIFTVWSCVLFLNLYILYIKQVTLLNSELKSVISRNQETWLQQALFFIECICGIFMDVHSKTIFGGYRK